MSAPPRTAGSEQTTTHRTVMAGQVVEANVTEAVREGLSWRVELNVPSWGVAVVWRGFDRELAAGAPAAGEVWWLQVPHTAWRVLGGEA